MARGIKGPSGQCNCPGLVWGGSISAPDITDGAIAEHGESDDKPVQQLSVPYDTWHYNREYAGEHTTYNQPVSKTVVPDLWPRKREKRWFHFGTKVPATFPGRGCEDPVISSAKDGGDGTWEAQLQMAMAHEIKNEGEPTQSEGLQILGWTFMLGSRVCYVDGKQKKVVWRIHGRRPQNDGAVYTGSIFPTLGFGDLFVVDISTQTVQKNDGYRLQSLDGLTDTSEEYPAYDPLGMTKMEAEWLRGNIGTWDVLSSNSVNYQPAASCFQCGTNQLLVSSYYPGAPFWRVGRIGYSAPRFDTGDHPDVFLSAIDLSLDGAGVEGDYTILLPSIREFIDSSIHTSENPDTCWVFAVRKSSLGVFRAITARWHSKVYRQSSYFPGQNPEEKGMADGSLHPDEVAAGNIVIDGDQMMTQFNDSCTDFKLLCYNRRWDPIEKQNVDLLLFTTGGTVETRTVTSDFEEGDLQHGINSENGSEISVGWETGSTSGLGLGFIADGSSPISGLYSAVYDGPFEFESQEFLRRTANFINGGLIEFDYQYDNRKYGVRLDPFSELTNFPEVDNTLEVTINGAKVPITIDGTPYDTSVIDNAPNGVPDGNPQNEPAFYTTTRHVTITVPAGTCTISIRVHRRIAGHKIACKIDNVTFPQEMASDNIEGLNRYYSDGYQIRKVTKYAWAKRDEENSESLFSRAVTGPTYIEMDGSGRIIMGNCHYIARFLRDGTLDEKFGGPRGPGFPEKKGFIRFTASPNIVPAIPPCFDPDNRFGGGDPTADPPWGSTMFIATGKDTFQCRGMNGDIRDATEYPVDKSKYKYKHPITGEIRQETFATYLKALDGFWNQRAHGWTVEKNGTVLTPHTEIIWRPTKDSPTWPEKEPAWVNPPYRSDFKDSSTLTPFAPHSTRPHHPLQLAPGNQENKARWGLTNWIIARTYSDAWCRSPQTVWVRAIDDPPQADVEPGVKNEFWWNPDWDPEYIDGLFGPGASSFIGGPYKSARWRKVTARFNPNGYRHISYEPTVSLENVCEVHTEGATPEYVLTSVWRGTMRSGSIGFGGFTDFDAVADCGCGCC